MQPTVTMNHIIYRSASTKLENGLQFFHKVCTMQTTATIAFAKWRRLTKTADEMTTSKKQSYTKKPCTKTKEFFLQLFINFFNLVYKNHQTEVLLNHFCNARLQVMPRKTAIHLE